MSFLCFRIAKGVENVPKIKEYIVKNNLTKEENDPKDYFLRHNGAGQLLPDGRIGIGILETYSSQVAIDELKMAASIKGWC